METIKNLLNTYGRPLLSKWITRAVLYGAAALSAKLAISAPSNDTAGQVADWASAAVCAGLAMLIDAIHDKKDKA